MPCLVTLAIGAILYRVDVIADRRFRRKRREAREEIGRQMKEANW